MSNQKTVMFCAIRQGFKTGIFDTWEEARCHIDGYPGAEFECFECKKDANDYIQMGYGNGGVVHIYTDGSCIGKPNRRVAGWSMICAQTQNSGPVPGLQTSNRAELFAISKAVEYAKNQGSIAVIHSDSQLAVKSLTQYCKKWEKNGWRTVNGAPVKNLDIVKPLVSAYLALPNVTVQWISRDRNGAADALAKQAASNACIY